MRQQADSYSAAPLLKYFLYAGLKEVTLLSSTGKEFSCITIVAPLLNCPCKA